MAHSPQTKAKAVAAIIEGVPWDDVQRKYGVGRATLSRWMDEAKTELGTELSELDRNRGLPARQERARTDYTVALSKILVGSMSMLNTWVDVAGDEAFVRKQTDKAIALGDRVLDRVDSIVDKIGLGNGIE